MARQLTTFWQQHVSQWLSSGLTQAQYCKQHNVNPQRLSHHKRKLETKGKLETKAVKQGSKSGFISVPIPQGVPSPNPLTLHFASGLSLSGIAPNNVELVKQLATELS
jgi:hypothetical protein